LRVVTRRLPYLVYACPGRLTRRGDPCPVLGAGTTLPAEAAVPSSKGRSNLAPHLSSPTATSVHPTVINGGAEDGGTSASDDCIALSSWSPDAEPASSGTPEGSPELQSAAADRSTGSHRIRPRKGGVMSAPKKHPPEVRDRAIRPVDDLLVDEQLPLSVTGAGCRIGEQFGHQS